MSYSRRGKKCKWENKHTYTMKRLKGMLVMSTNLGKAIYKEEMPFSLMVDTSPTGIGWVINQEGEDGANTP